MRDYQFVSLDQKTTHSLEFNYQKNFIVPYLTHLILESVIPHLLPTTNSLEQIATMVKENDVIAIIIIVLFIVLALIAFGIYRLVHLARTQGTVSEESSGSGSLADD